MPCLLGHPVCKPILDFILFKSTKQRTLYYVVFTRTGWFRLVTVQSEDCYQAALYVLFSAAPPPLPSPLLTPCPTLYLIPFPLITPPFLLTSQTLILSQLYPSTPPPSLLPSPTLYFLFQSTPFLAPINFPSPPIHSPLLSSSLSSNSLPPPVLPSPSLPLPCHSLPYTYFFTSVTFPPSFFPSLHFPSLPLPFTSLPNTYFFTSVTFPPSCPSLPFTSPQTHSPSLPPPLLFSPSLISFFIFTPLYSLHSSSSLPLLLPLFIFTPCTFSSFYLHSLYSPSLYIHFLPLLPPHFIFTPFTSSSLYLQSLLPFQETFFSLPTSSYKPLTQFLSLILFSFRPLPPLSLPIPLLPPFPNRLTTGISGKYSSLNKSYI